MNRSTIHTGLGARRDSASKRTHAWTAVGTALGLSVISTIFMASAASAEVVDASKYEDAYGPDQYENYCDVAGLTVEISGVASGRFQLVSRGPGLGYFSDRAKFTDTITNVATGASAYFVGQYQGHSLKVTDNGDGTLTVRTQNTGHAVIYDEAGNRIGSSTGGMFQYERTFYHMGTPADPSDDVRFGDVVIVRRTNTPVDECAAVVPAIS